MRRATGCITSCAGCWGNFYPRPPRGGRRYTTRAICRVGKISIHALREEGDKNSSAAKITPRLFLSTPSARRATSYALLGRCMRFYFYPRPPRGGRLFGRLKQRRKKPISIHALREEGDRTGRADNRQEREFLSTPSARRATTSMAAAVRPRSFLSTPSARRATITDRAVRYLQTISIHALREEGDVCAIYDISELISFLSTPSARRATERSGPQEAQEAISIHALREEGDPRRQHRRPAGLKISIHALREEGDAEFAVLHQVTEISIHALREEGDFFNK